MNTPLVSVVMAFLNAETFIEQAVESVRGQTYEHWELLFVDDGSSDASSEIARQHARRDPQRMRYFEHPRHRNRGASPSRNLGIAHAKGTYVAFLDADDVWLPHKLEEQVAVLNATPEAAVVYGPALFWYGWTGNPDDIQRDFICLPAKGTGAVDALIQPPTLLPLYLRGECVPVFPGVILARHEALEGDHGFDPRFRGMLDDATLHAKIFLDHTVYVSSNCWHKYRQHPRSYTNRTFAAGGYPAARTAYLEWLAGYLWKRGIRDGEIWTILVRELGPYHRPVLYQLYRLARFASPVKRVAASALPKPIRSLIRATLYRNRSSLRGG